MSPGADFGPLTGIIEWLDKHPDPDPTELLGRIRDRAEYYNSAFGDTGASIVELTEAAVSDMKLVLLISGFAVCDNLHPIILIAGTVSWMELVHKRAILNVIPNPLRRKISELFISGLRNGTSGAFCLGFLNDLETELNWVVPKVLHWFQSDRQHVHETLVFLRIALCTVQLSDSIHDEITQEAMSALADPNPAIRRLGCEILGVVSGQLSPAVERRLRSMAADPDPRVQAAATSSLDARIGNDGENYLD